MHVGTVRLADWIFLPSLIARARPRSLRVPLPLTFGEEVAWMISAVLSYLPRSGKPGPSSRARLSSGREERQLRVRMR